jgi:hypothetical protein
MRIDSSRRYGDRRRGFGRPVFGLVVIVIGVLALLDNLHLVDGHALWAYWPLVFVLAGLGKIFRRGWPASPLAGGVLIAVGAAWTAQNLGYVHLNWRDWWPAFVILGGAMIVLRSLFPSHFRHRHHRFRGQFRQSQIDHGDALNIKTAFSGTALRNDSQDFKGGDIDLSLAGLELDLRQASINGEAELRISAVMSGVNIRVPTDWQVILHGVPTMGGVEDRSVPPMNPLKRLVIRTNIVMGGLEIKN